MRAVTEAICKSFDAPVQPVRVIINEMPKDNFAIAGELVRGRKAAKQ
ncbi:tautomerase family protein [Cloacibacillus evryensis]